MALFGRCLEAFARPESEDAKDEAIHQEVGGILVAETCAWICCIGSWFGQQ